jgi:hypothetical protein
MIRAKACNVVLLSDRVKSPFSGFFSADKPLVSSEREPLTDVTTTDKK